jgi:hypothetical protein
MKKNLTLLLGIFWLGVCSADEPLGNYSYDFSADNGSVLWNVLGDYSTDFLHFTIDDQDGWGQLWSGDTYLGYITGNGRATRLKLFVRNSDSAPNSDGSGTIRTDTQGFLSLKVDTNTFSLIGTEYVTQRRKGFFPFFFNFLGGDSHQDSVSLPLSDGNDGHWNLSLTITNSGNWLKGDATITFANGATMDFSVRGLYKPSTDKSKLLLQGRHDAQGAFLQLTLDGAAQTVDLMRGRVSGQSVNFHSAPAAPPGA